MPAPDGESGALPKVRVLGTGGTIAHVAADRLDFVLYSERGTTIGIDEMLRRVPEVARRAGRGGAVLPGERAELSGARGVAAAGAPVHRAPGGRPGPRRHRHHPRLGVRGGDGLLPEPHGQVGPAGGPRELGFLGYADSDGEVVYYRAVERRHTTGTEFNAGLDELPHVDVLSVHAGADGRLVAPAVERGAAGLVIAAAGAGSMPPAFVEAAAGAVARGVPVVVASRGGNGRVVERGWMRRQGLVCADNLTPQKARVLLMLGLTRTRDREALQRMYDVY